MPIQDNTAKRSLSYLLEVEPGVTPAGSFQDFAQLEFNLDLDPELLEDLSSTGNRQRGPQERGNYRASGSMKMYHVPNANDVFLEAALQGTWDDDVLEIGMIQRSFSILEKHNDSGAWCIHKGVVITTMDRQINRQGYVELTFELLGMDTTEMVTTTAPTRIAATTQPKFKHANGVFKEGGIANDALTVVGMKLDNSVTGEHTLGSNALRSITSGDVIVSATVSALWVSADLYNKYRNQITSSLENDITAGTYFQTWEIPAMNYTEAKKNTPTSAGITVDMTAAGHFDSTKGTTLRITRGTV